MTHTRLIALLFLLTTLPRGVFCTDEREFETFWDWKCACDELPRYERGAPQEYATPLSWRQLMEQVNDGIHRIRKQLGSRRAWLNEKVPVVNFFEEQDEQCVAFVQKIQVPVGAKIAIHGDFHGDVHSINNFIKTWNDEGYMDGRDPFVIDDPNFYILFLGDFTDRGWYAAEVLYTVCRLKATNPRQVYFVRGNHESISMNARDGFARELKNKFPKEDHSQFYRLYDHMPMALYLGSGSRRDMNYAQCCHGGLEIGFDPRPLLASDSSVTCASVPRLMRSNGMDILLKHLGQDAIEAADVQFSAFENNIVTTLANGFLWSDFIVDSTGLLGISRARGLSTYAYGEASTRVLLNAWSGDNYQLRTVLRGHQHSSDFNDPMMQRIFNADNLGHPADRGLGKLWIGDKPFHRDSPGLLIGVLSVTFCVSPNLSYQIPFDAFGLLTTAERFEDWRLQAYLLEEPICEKGQPRSSE